MDIKSILAIVAGVLALLSFVPYLNSIFKCTTKPSRVSWSIWAIQGWILTSTYYLSGGIHNIWLPLADTILVTTIALLSFKYGSRQWSKIDLVTLIGAAITITIWITTSVPLYALYSGVMVGILASLPTIKKAYQKPGTENPWAWGIFSLAAIINLFSLPTLLSVENIYPFYLLFVNGAIFLSTSLSKNRI